MLSDGLYTCFWEKTISALASSSKLTTVSFGILEYLWTCPPERVLTLPTVRDLSFIVSQPADDVDGDPLNIFILKITSLMRAFPAAENITIHCFHMNACENGLETTMRDILQQVGLDCIAPPRTLDLLNVPFIVDDLTSPHFIKLHSLSIAFTKEVRLSHACSGTLPVTDKSGSTSLRSLTIHSEQDDSAFNIIPRSGLRDLSLIGFGSEYREYVDLLTPGRLGRVLSGHLNTLESLALLPSGDIGTWFDIAMVPLLPYFTQLRHLAVGIEDKDDATTDTSEYTLVSRLSCSLHMP